MREGFLQYLPVGLLVGIILLAELVLVGGTWVLGARQAAPTTAPRRPAVTTPRRSGTLLYTDYFYLFQAAGVILLVAIIGAITLTLRQRPACGGRTSAARSPAARRTVELRKVRSGSGI